MKYVEPQVYLLAKTDSGKGMTEYLTKVLGSFEDAQDFTRGHEGGNLTKFGGKLCYRSWKPYEEGNENTNPNVTKIREDTTEYIRNILASGHGSVLEHVNFTFLLDNVSRVATHELVRHRAGCAYSQESLRFVRLDKLDMYLPQCFQDNEAAKVIFEDTVKYLEETQIKLAKVFDLDNQSFSIKKQITSSMRRLAPIGLATRIMFTGNVRALRHVIQMRCSPHAEEEMQIIFSKVADLCKAEEPDLFQDLNDDYQFEYDKV